MAESERRRSTQLAFNEKHGIQPVGVSKKIRDVMEGAYAAPGEGRASKRGRGAAPGRSAAEVSTELLDPKALTREISRLEARMYELARNLDFEEAAATRDQLNVLKERLLKA